VGANVPPVTRTQIPLRFRAFGREVSGATLFSDGADRVLVLASTSAELRIELRSVYLGGDENPTVLVAEAATAPGEPARLTHRVIEDANGILVYERRRALYDHLQRFQELAAAAGCGELQITGVDDAAREIDPAHSVSPRLQPLSRAAKLE
jgi:hypothetical protein